MAHPFSVLEDGRLRPRLVRIRIEIPDGEDVKLPIEADSIVSDFGVFYPYLVDRVPPGASPRHVEVKGGQAYLAFEVPDPPPRIPPGVERRQRQMAAELERQDPLAGDAAGGDVQGLVERLREEGGSGGEGSLEGS